jgi:hypothetical protein
MSYGDDIITSDGFEPDEEDELAASDYEAEFGSDGDIDGGDEEPADR